MPVNLSAPDPAALFAVPGVRIGVTEAGVRKANRKDLTVVLIDEADATLGEGEKLDVHRAGTLHRAFSVFAFNAAGELLLQRRALGKYHSGGLWTNSCCGHPRPGEATIDAARRRLGEEMGGDELTDEASRTGEGDPHAGLGIVDRSSTAPSPA